MMRDGAGVWVQKEAGKETEGKGRKKNQMKNEYWTRSDSRELEKDFPSTRRLHLSKKKKKK